MPIQYVTITPEKIPYHIRLTIGSDKLPYPLDSGSPVATLLEAKIIFNSVISTPFYRFICADIKEYFH